MSTKEKLLLILLGLALAISVVAKDKPWTQWTDKDARKILNDSGWGQTQTFLSNQESTSTLPTTGVQRGATITTGTTSITGTKGGAIDEAPGVNYRIRFLSAKPIRQALLRLMLLDPKATPEQKDKAQQFVDTKYDQVVVIAASYDQDGLPKDNRFTMPVFQAFSGGTTATLKNNTYLEMKGGQRVFLQEYRLPSGDGMGAIFIFPRIVNDKPILDAKSGGEVRFYSEFPKPTGNDPQVRLNVRFKVSDMMYDSVIEY
jgi:hypothetical protein